MSSLGMECAFLIVNVGKGVSMVSPTATELALINIFIIVLIILEGIVKIGSAKSDNPEPY